MVLEPFINPDFIKISDKTGEQRAYDPNNTDC